MATDHFHLLIDDAGPPGIGASQPIRYHHRVPAASWSSAQAQWTVQADTGESPDSSARVKHSWCICYACGGYFDHGEGVGLEFAGADNLAGQIVQPQFGPAAPGNTGKNKGVTGSRATAVTRVPA